MIKSFVPSDYRALLDFISPEAFKVIEWKTAAAQFIQLTKQSMDSEKISSAAKESSRILAIDLSLKGQNYRSASGQEIDDSKHAGETETRFEHEVLDVYFSQFFSTKGVFLDLRAKFFRTSEYSGTVFAPSSFVHTFDEKFRLGLLDIYEGYYLSRPKKMENGLLALGLVKNGDPEKIEETKKLLFSHFGDADQGLVSLELTHFKKSFHALFRYLKRESITLTSDFLFLGIYLVTLYLCLAESNQKVDVKKAFLTSWRRNSS